MIGKMMRKLRLGSEMEYSLQIVMLVLVSRGNVGLRSTFVLRRLFRMFLFLELRSSISNFEALILKLYRARKNIFAA